MKVLFYNHTGRASGAEKVLSLALKHLDKSAITPHVVCPPGELSHELEMLGLPVVHIGELNARITLLPHKLLIYCASLIKVVRALRREVKRSGAEIVHANSPRGGIAAIFATAGMATPVVWHVHDEFTRHPITALVRFVARVCRRCTIIAVSEATAKSFIADSEELNQRVRVIHNAVDLQEIDNCDRAGSIREELGLQADDFLFGIVGQITPRKGQFELLKAFARAASDMPSAKLLVIGAPIFDHDTAYHQNVKQLTAELGLTGRVLFLGHRTDAIAIIKQLDTLVINSKSEAFVMVAIEAMACRVPVIATDVGGTREMIRDGYNSILVDTGEENQMVTALRKMHGDKRLRELFAVRSRERVENELNIDRFAIDFRNALLGAALPGATKTALSKRPLDAIENR